MLTKIIYKNFRSNLKNYILFFLSNIVAIMELFVFYGIRSIIKNSITDKVTAEALKTDFQIAVGIIAVITLMLMFYAMKCYIKLRIKDYSMFLILGMKKKAVSLLLLFEYCIGCVISLILGIGTGRILLYIIQRLLVKYYPQYIRMYVLRYQIYKNVCLGSISIMILVFVVLLIWLDGRSLGMLMAEDKKNEKRPISYMWIILAVIGIVLMMAGIILYCGSDTQYLYAHGVLLMGLILAVVFGLALFLNLLKKCKNFYYRYMLDLNQLYSRLILNEDDPVESSKTAETMAEKLGIYKLLDKKPYELSGGEKQRTAICRAMAENPELILADEPTGNLDSNSSKQVIHTLSYINQEFGKTIVMVTHDPQMASYCSRLILLKDGVILEDLKNSGDQEAFYQEILGKMKEL